MVLLFLNNEYENHKFQQIENHQFLLTYYSNNFNHLELYSNINNAHQNIDSESYIFLSSVDYIYYIDFYLCIQQINLIKSIYQASPFFTLEYKVHLKSLLL